MKRIVSILLMVTILITSFGLALAQDATTSATAAPSAPTAPGGDGSRMIGRITAVGDATITITTMGQNGAQMNGSQPGGTPPQNGDQSSTQQGSAPAQGNGQADGSTPPTDNSGAQGNGQTDGSTPPTDGSGAQANGTGDMPAIGEEQTITVTVTEDTAITSGATMETLTFSDLVVGMMVEITVQGNATDGYTALTIQTQAEMSQTTTDTAAPTETPQTSDAT
jgi:hypothetical protein